MSNNPFMDYQEQFFKLWNDNMDKMLESDAYKAIAKNVPGAEMYTKAMEAMVPNVENYWKTMAASMPNVTAMNPMDYWKSFTEQNPMDYWKNFATQNPMDYWKNFAEKNPVMDYWKEFAQKNPVMDYWKDYAEKNPFADYWKGFTENMPNMGEYWQSFQKMLPNMSDYWKSFPTMFPGMNSYWDSFAKMMPDPKKFADMAPFKVPGFDAFTKVFDMWKSFGDPTAMVQDFQQKYMDVMADVMKSLFPENVQPFMAKPVDFMNMMVEYYKQFVSPWVEIDTDIMERLAKGDADAYIDFFKEYQDKYAESVEKYFNIMGMGLNREANEDYMKAMNTWNKAMISMGELMAVINKTSQESFEKISAAVQKGLEEGVSLTTFRDFYTVWYKVTEEAFEELLSTDEFAKVFDDFSDRYAQFMIAQNKVYERMLSFLPIPTNTDMKSLYKTVYDLRKDVRDLKKAVAALEEKGGK